MLENPDARYLYVRVDLSQWEEVMAGYKAQHPGARSEAAKVLNAVLCDYINGELAAEEEDDFWGESAVRNGQHKNVNVYRQTLASVLNAYRQRHNTPFGNNTGVVRYVLGLYLASLSKGKGD